MTDTQHIIYLAAWAIAILNFVKLAGMAVFYLLRIATWRDILQAYSTTDVALILFSLLILK